MENTSPRQVVFNLLALAAIITCLYFFFRVFDIDEVRARIEEAGIWAPLVLIAAKASTIIIAPLSGSPLYPIGGALFGFWKALLYLVIGDMIGGTVAFLLARFFGRSVVHKLLGGQENLVSQALEMMSSIKGFLLARLCFVSFPEVPAYAGGLSRIPFVPFLLIYTLVGIVPTALIAGLGSTLTSESNPIIFGGIFIAGSVVSGISMLVFIHLLKREKNTVPSV